MVVPKSKFQRYQLKKKFVPFNDAKNIVPKKSRFAHALNNIKRIDNLESKLLHIKPPTRLFEDFKQQRAIITAY